MVLDLLFILPWLAFNDIFSESVSWKSKIGFFPAGICAAARLGACRYNLICGYQVCTIMGPEDVLYILGGQSFFSAQSC